jgi:hypothetical protein
MRMSRPMEHDGVNGVLPIVAETWARSDSQPTTCNPSTSGAPLTRKQCAKKAANHDKDHGPAIDNDDL